MFSTKFSKELNDNFYLVNHTYQVIETSKDIELDLSRAESNARAYYITKDLRFFNKYESAELFKDLKRINSLITPIEIQASNISQLEALLEKRLLVLENVVSSLSGKFPTEDVIALNLEIRKINDRIVNIERNRLVERQQASYDALSKAQTVIVISCGLSILMSIMILILIRKEIQKRKQNEIDLIQLNENKNKFFSIISHDLRGPVKGIVALCKGLLETKLPSGLNQYLVLMHSSALATSNLLENLLTWSKSQMNKI